MSFPEPHGAGALATNASFLRGAHRVLRRGGHLTIVTDQRSVYQGATAVLQSRELSRIFRLVSSSSQDQGGTSFIGSQDQGGTASEQSRQAPAGGAGCVLPRGWEGGGKSFFNGLWASRGFTDRFFMCYSAVKD